MSVPDRTAETTRQWLSGLAVIVTTMVCVYAFSRLSLEWTAVLAGGTLSSLLFFFWRVGRRNRG